MNNYNVFFFAKSDGSEPARDFMSTLDDKMQAKIAWTIELLKTDGPEVRLPYSKCLEDGIYEIRAKVSSNITRVLYFFCVGKNIILTNGFVKKSQKTPKNEIDLAKKYRDEYMSRRNDHDQF